jgi:hypothetical protein
VLQFPSLREWHVMKFPVRGHAAPRGRFVRFCSTPEHMGWFCHRYSLRNKLPTNLHHDSGQRLRPTVREAGLKVRPLVRKSRLRTGAAIAGR